MEAIHQTPRKGQRVLFWVVMPVVAEVGWLGLLWPLVPSTGIAWLVTLLVPLPIAGYVYLVARAIDRLSLRSNPSVLIRGLAVLLAVSVGAIIFLLLFIVERSLGGQFHYRYLGGH